VRKSKTYHYFVHLLGGWNEKPSFLIKRVRNQVREGEGAEARKKEDEGCQLT